MGSEQQMVKSHKSRIKTLMRRIAVLSLEKASKEQNLDSLCRQLSKIVPDIQKQYTTFDLDNAYLKTKARIQHAFQIRMVLEAIQNIPEKSELRIVDIGDSAGTHLTYLMRLLTDDERYNLKSLSVMSINSDPVAIDKIIAKGIPATLCRAEEYIHKEQQSTDIIMSFEMLEHLNDPISFLYTISKREGAELFVLTVPYLSRSRIGLHHIRKGLEGDFTPETTHIFELSPKDWRLIFIHCGWKILFEEIYFQYPRRSLLRALQPLWKRIDFEGFYGVVLERNRYPEGQTRSAS